MSGAALGLLLILGVIAADLMPNEVLDLSRWTLTLPLDADGNERADEVSTEKLLGGFQDESSFFVDHEARAVAFRARCGGPTTKGSSYPRSELRELNLKGRDASWKTDDEAVHRLEMTARIMCVPKVKPHVVCAQIHDAKSDLLMIRLEGRKLMVERSGLPDLVLDDQYDLRTPFQVKIEAGQGRVRVFHDGRQALDWEVKQGGCYFKAGCYTQSNVKRGDAPDDFAEVQIMKLVLEWASEK